MYKLKGSRAFMYPQPVDQSHLFYLIFEWYQSHLMKCHCCTLRLSGVAVGHPNDLKLLFWECAESELFWFVQVLVLLDHYFMQNFFFYIKVLNYDYFILCICSSPSIIHLKSIYIEAICHLQAVWTSGEEDARFCWRNFISFWVCPELIWLVCITVQVIFIIPVEILHPKGISLGISGSGTEKKQWELSISKSMARVPHHISPLFCGHHVAVMCFREIAQ